MNKTKSVFTLIELSIVLIIIGLTTVGIIGGKNLINSAKLSNARSFTLSSPVIAIENLALWLDASAKEGFINGEGEIDNTDITIWNDINHITTNKKDAQVVNSPKYRMFGINSLPS